MGRRQPRRSARSTTTGSAPASSSTSRTGSCTRRTCTSARTRRTAARLRVYTETAWASIFARNLFRRPPREELGGLRAQLHDHRRAQSSRRTRRPRGPGPSTAILRPPAADGDHHRRDDVRRRDQEVRLHGHELPHAGRGRAADALARSTSGADGRLGHLLRPHRAPARPPCRPTRCAASSATTSTAGASGYIFNFEGGCYAKTIRLSPMYEPDIFATTKRFGTILENVDIDPRDPRAGPRLRALHREHPRRLPAPLHRQRRPDGHRRPARATSSSSRPTRSACCRRSAGSPASRRPTTSSAATRPSSPAPRSGSRSRRPRSRACFGAPFLPRHPGEYAHMLDGPPGRSATSRSGW